MMVISNIINAFAAHHGGGRVVVLGRKGLRVHRQHPVLVGHQHICQQLRK